MNFKSVFQFNSQGFCSKHSILWVISLLFIGTLFFSPFISVFSGVSPFALGAPDIVVSSEGELRNAVYNAPAIENFVIALNADIALTSSLVISEGKNITLTSEGNSEFFKLIGVAEQSTIIIEPGGVLVLDGIVVTHVKDAVGQRVTVKFNGSFIMVEGIISGNTAGGGWSGGGGVYNWGTFEMYGGKISNNIAFNGGGVTNYQGNFTMFKGIISDNHGGGVTNYQGNFTMFNGAISDNTGNGGVDNYGVFEMYGGVLSGNFDGGGWSSGGGVDSNNGNFSMFGGVISGNFGYYGGGVYNSHGNFSMSGGEIFGNRAGTGGGVHNGINGTFILLGGKIFGNTANEGGGVHNAGDREFVSGFFMSGGEILGNTAERAGGGVHNSGDGIFILSGGKISKNIVLNSDPTVTSDGGGVHNFNIFKMLGGEISGNSARNGGGVANGDTFEMLGGEISSNAAVNGGGIHSMYNFSMFDGTISNNQATHGGGIHSYFHEFYSDPNVALGNCRLFGGIISDNTASGNGGGIWIYPNHLNRLFVYDKVVFKNNRASTAYNREPIYDEMYRLQIGQEVTWTTPFTQGYNNYDISDIFDVPVTRYTVTVYGSFATHTGEGSYAVGESVTVYAGTSKDYTFLGWTVIGDVALMNGVTETFTMPANNVVIRANWRPIPTGDSGGGRDGFGSGGRDSSITPSELEPSPTTPQKDEAYNSPIPEGEKNSLPQLLWITALLIIIAGLIAVSIVWMLTTKKDKT